MVWSVELHFRGVNGSGGSTLNATGEALGFLIFRTCATSTVKGPRTVRHPQVGERNSAMRRKHTAEAELDGVDFDRHDNDRAIRNCKSEACVAMLYLSQRQKALGRLWDVKDACLLSQVEGGVTTFQHGNRKAGQVSTGCPGSPRLSQASGPVLITRALELLPTSAPEGSSQ